MRKTVQSANVITYSNMAPPVSRILRWGWVIQSGWDVGLRWECIRRFHKIRQLKAYTSGLCELCTLFVKERNRLIFGQKAKFCTQEKLYSILCVACSPQQCALSLTLMSLSLVCFAVICTARVTDGKRRNQRMPCMFLQHVKKKGREDEEKLLLRQSKEDCKEYDGESDTFDSSHSVSTPRLY